MNGWFRLSVGGVRGACARAFLPGGADRRFSDGDWNMGMVRRLAHIRLGSRRHAIDLVARLRMVGELWRMTV